MSLSAENIRAGYGRSGPDIITDWSFSLEPGEIKGLTGASGAGKSTAARVLVGLLPPRAGTVTCDGTPVTMTKGKLSGAVAMLFQSPRRSCNPRLRLGQIIAEPGYYRPRHTGRELHQEVADAARRVGLTPDLLERLPRQVSDGQLQRAALARVLMSRPSYLICDEATAMLDAVTTASIVAVVRELATAGMGIVVVTHDRELLDAWASSAVAVR